MIRERKKARIRETVGAEKQDKVPKKSKDKLPENVQEAYDEYDETGWKGNTAGQTEGTKAGKKYKNENGKLPTKDAKGNDITYKEYDVNNKKPGENRDAERFVKGSDGSTYYYTDSHYGDATSPTGLPDFVKIK